MCDGLFGGSSGSASFFVLVLVLAAGLGCVQAQPTALDMTPAGAQFDRKHSVTVSVEVAGGTDGEYMMSAPNSAIQEAVVSAIRDSGLFQVAESESADYRFDVVLSRYNFPIVGFDVSVGVEMVWNLSSISEQKTVWQSLIETSASGGTEVAFNAQTRSALLAGQAIKDNIVEALAQLSAAEFR
jgi:hypothetical protein